MLAPSSNNHLHPGQVLREQLRLDTLDPPKHSKYWPLLKTERIWATNVRYFEGHISRCGYVKLVCKYRD